MASSAELVSMIKCLKQRLGSLDLTDADAQKSILTSVVAIESKAKQLNTKEGVTTALDGIESKLESMTDQDEIISLSDTEMVINHSVQIDTNHRDRILKVGDFEFPFDRTALLMIDFQRDFLTPRGFGELLGNKVEILHSAIKPAEKILTMARQVGLTVVHTLESHLPDLSDCPKRKLHINNKYKIGDKGPMGRILIREEYGNNIIDCLKPISNEKVIYKPGKGAFYQTELFDYLNNKNITHLIFTGVTTEVCVFQTLCEARDRGFYNLLLTDATASYFPQFKKSIVEMTVAQGKIHGWAATTDQLTTVLENFEKKCLKGEEKDNDKSKRRGECTGESKSEDKCCKESKSIT